MKEKPGKINRRTFIGTTGAAAAGLTVLPCLFSSDRPGSDPEKWWEQEPLRIVEFEEGFEFRKKFELLNDLGANMEHLTRFTDTSPGTSFLDAHNLFKGQKVNFSSLKNYLTEAKKSKVRVVVYYNVHAIEISYARQHPDWQQIKDNGNPIEDVYNVDSSFCINSPWREEVFRTLKKLASYEIDGVFYDGPIFFSATCHCESCKKLFNQKYLREMPSKSDLSSEKGSSGWREIIEFQSDSIANFLRQSNKILKEINPGILLYMNGNTLGPSWPTGRDNRKIIKETDILGAEGGFLYGEFREPVFKPGAMAKLLETQAGGKPAVVFDAAKQGPWSFSTLPGGEMSILYGQTITSQANVWLAISDVKEFHDTEIEVIRKFNRLIKDNPDPFFRARSMARIALVWPQESGNYYTGSSIPLTDFTKERKAEKAGNTEEEFYGFYDGLSRNHFPFDVIDEEAMNDGLDKYELLICPNATCLGKEAADKIRGFIKKGRNIVSTFETSHYDEFGKKLDNFELQDVFGIEASGEVFGPLNWDYVIPMDEQHFSFKEIRNKYIKAPSYGLKLKANIKAPIYFCKPLPGSYAGSPEVSDFPFLIENSYGKGRSVYIAGTFGASLHKFHFPEYYQILFNLVSEFSSPVIRMGNTPSSIEISVRRKGKSVFIYLINFTSEMKRPIERIIPCTNIKIEISLTDKAKSLKALCLNKNLQFSDDGKSISFILPLIEDYEVIRIELR
jgi:hypothetical protein